MNYYCSTVFKGAYLPAPDLLLAHIDNINIVLYDWSGTGFPEMSAYIATCFSASDISHIMKTYCLGQHNIKLKNMSAEEIIKVY